VIGSGRRTSPWLLAVLFPVVFGIGILVRMWLWPARGLVGDLDQFVLWVHGIAVNGWGRAYDQDLAFPSVMAWIWGALAAVEPAFRSVVDSSDPAIRSLMKVPASLADILIAASLAWWFRDRPWVALGAAAAVLLWPVTWYVSAWWGQYEPIYVLPAVLAVLAARARLPLLVAVLVALSVMTKPQALPLLVPFAAWFLGSQGIRGTLRAAVVGAVVVLLTWLPFLGAGGPGNYLANLRGYQDGVFGVLSLRAWNPWWILQVTGNGGSFAADTTAIAGPLTFRVLGFVAAGLLAVVVFLGVLRRPTAGQLALGLAAITLVVFVCLTTMHERYAYPAYVFLLMAATSRTLLAAWAAFAVVFALDLVVSVPPPELAIATGPAVGAVGAVGVAGALVITGVMLVTLVTLLRARRISAFDDIPTISSWA
jgi:hypothetical protein